MQNNNGVISAVEIDTNGISNPWNASLVRVSRANGMIELKTNNYETGQSLLIQKSGEDEGIFFRDNGESEGPTAVFKIDREIPEAFYGSFYFMENTSTSFSIYFDTITKTAHGTFDISFDDDDSLPVWQLNKGVFFDVPYDLGELHVNGEIRADLDSLPFESDNNLGFVNSSSELEFNFNDEDAAQTIRILLPLDIKSGTYTSQDNNLEGIFFEFKDFTEMGFNHPTAGNINLAIIYHNPETKAIAGTFSFDRPSWNEHPLKKIRHGYFEFIYNDWR